MIAIKENQSSPFSTSFQLCLFVYLPSVSPLLCMMQVLIKAMGTLNEISKYVRSMSVCQMMCFYMRGTRLGC